MIKRCFDILFSFIGIIVTFPIVLICAILIKIDTKGPIIFKQKRTGRYGTYFNILKLRTMTVDADKSGNVTVGLEDPRVTKIGAHLRRWKLDEIPQLINILKGDMSFVGPRPEIPGNYEKLTGESRKILELRPGITCAASLQFRHMENILSKADDPLKYHDEVIFPQKVKANLDYYYNGNVFTDIKLICRTVGLWLFPN